MFNITASCCIIKRIIQSRRNRVVYICSRYANKARLFYKPRIPCRLSMILKIKNLIKNESPL